MSKYRLLESSAKSSEKVRNEFLGAPFRSVSLAAPRAERGAMMARLVIGINRVCPKTL